MGSIGKMHSGGKVRLALSQTDGAGPSDESAGAEEGAAPTTVPRRSSEISADHASYVTVGPDADGQRLDNFLLRLARGVPKEHVYRIVRRGEVRVNKGRAGVDRKLAVGDEIRIPPLRLAERDPTIAPRVELPVLFEDDHLLVVDKPAGLAAHGGSGVAHGLIERIRATRGAATFLELAHRLDRETSGVLMLGKSRRALVALHAQLRAGSVQKRYLALVVGHWHNDRQHVKLSLAKFVTGGGERRVAVDDDGAAAHTIFNLRQRWRDFSLLEAELKTGRTHQIRVHLAHLGYPIVGDDKYGDFELNRRVARGEFGARCTRMFLHAMAVRLVHPVSGEMLDLQAPLPRECEAILQALGRAAAT
jgi:23S rRNA pseudouridine955/2504/2580 synthase